MLNHSKLFNEIAQATTTFLVDFQREQVRARNLWHAVVADRSLAAAISAGDWSYLVPSWEEALDDQELVVRQDGPYTVFAVDGSQIYPDRHQGLACYVLNIGTALLDYGVQSSACFASQPYFFSGTVEQVHPDVVNCERTAFEFSAGLELGRQHPHALFLFDGSLIFWHLDSKEEAVKRRFLNDYCGTLQKLYENGIQCAGYISLPKSRELVNILRAAHELIAPQQRDALTPEFQGACLVDADIVQFFLKAGHRTILFENRSPIVQEYPKQVRPYFFYLNNGVEIVRVEVPAWIAKNAALRERVASIVLDQSHKGNGYPVALAEAHEQAVVTSADRECFYHLVQRVMQKNNAGYVVSQKSAHKRVLGI